MARLVSSSQSRAAPRKPRQGGEPGRCELVDDPHVVDGAAHFAAAIVQAEVTGGGLAVQHQHLAHVDAGALAHLQQVMAVLIVAHRGQQPGVSAKARQVLGDVAPHPAGGGAHPARVGVADAQVVVAAATDIHVGTTDHHGVGSFPQHIAAPLHIALAHQAGDVARQRRAADAEPVRQLLLGNHGILAQQGEDLLLTFCHRQTSSYKRLSIIAEKRFPAIAAYENCRFAHKNSADGSKRRSAI